MNAAVGRIGPNAIIRVAEALEHQRGHAMTEEVFAMAGLARYLDEAPHEMVDEEEARRLHVMLRTLLGASAAAEVSREAGVATANYLLANRIPKPVQFVLRSSPAVVASRVLLAAVSRHAWTFAGSGRFEAIAGPPSLLTIRDNPLTRGQASDSPVCDYYGATFEHLFRELVQRRTRVTELTCEARGDDACRFELRW